MSRIAFVLLILLTWYLAGMYRAAALMALCAVELLMLLISCILPFCFRRNLSVSFPREFETAEEGTDALCHVTVRNSGVLPISRFAVRFRMRYPQDKRAARRKVYGGAERGESDLTFRLHAPHCGLVEVKLDRLRVRDYLALFSASKKLDVELRVAVFPRERALRFAETAADWNEGAPVLEQTIDRAAESSSEIRHLREYREGDPMRRIHWNLSARTEQLWIREYERETDSMEHVLLDTAGFERATAAETSAFYKLLSALTLGLLGRVAVVRVHWYKHGRLASMDISDAEQCRELLFALYRAEFSLGPAEQSAISVDAFRLTAGLALYWKDTLLHQFSADTLEQEIEETALTL